jgi:hypothetical protein
MLRSLGIPASLVSLEELKRAVMDASTIGGRLRAALVA